MPKIAFSCARDSTAIVAHDSRTSGIAEFGAIALNLELHVLNNDEKYRDFRRKQFFHGIKIA